VLSRDPKRMGDRFSDNTCVKGPEKVSFLLFAEPLSSTAMRSRMKAAHLSTARTA
jgi:hypothetical protein